MLFLRVWFSGYFSFWVFFKERNVVYSYLKYQTIYTDFSLNSCYSSFRFRAFFPLFLTRKLKQSH